MGKEIVLHSFYCMKCGNKAMDYFVKEAFSMKDFIGKNFIAHIVS